MPPRYFKRRSGRSEVISFHARQLLQLTRYIRPQLCPWHVFHLLWMHVPTTRSIDKHLRYNRRWRLESFGPSPAPRVPARLGPRCLKACGGVSNCAFTHGIAKDIDLGAMESRMPVSANFRTAFAFPGRR